MLSRQSLLTFVQNNRCYSVKTGGKTVKKEGIFNIH